MKNESGSVLFYILIAIVLFAALSFAMNQIGRGGGDMKSELRQLQAAEILQYARALKTAVQGLRISNGCEDTQISFENNIVTAGYENTFAPDDMRCHIFEKEGGSIAYVIPDEDWLDKNQSAEPGYQEWFLTSRGNMNGLGTQAAHELTLILPFITKSLCMALNETLGNGATIPQENDGPGDVSFKFTGIYADTGQVGYEISELPGKMNGCVEGEDTYFNTFPAGSYHFFQVLIVR